MKRRILFLVSNAADVPSFADFKLEWEAFTGSNSEHGFQALQQSAVDAIVLDDEFLAHAAAEFLGKVAAYFPNTARLLLCEQGSPSAQVAKHGGWIQQFLVRPTTAGAVISATERAGLLKNWMAAPALKQLYGQMKKVPSVPQVYARLTEAIKSPNSDLADVGQIIGQDPSLTARVLQMVNSPFFGLGQTITSPAEAVGHLGIQRIKGLLLLAHVFSTGGGAPGSPVSLESLWAHCLKVGEFARRIAQAATNQMLVSDAAYTAGLLHDVGKLLLAANLPQDYSSVLQRCELEKQAQDSIEREVFGSSHAEVGGFVMAMWGLPAEIVQAIAHHHQPEKNVSKLFSPALAVHVANAISHELDSGPDPIAQGKLDRYYLEEIGYDGHLDSWRQICRANTG